MKAFVTGGTGFIGSHLVDTLIADEDYSEVRCLVRSNEKWLKGKNYLKVPGDLHDLSVLKKHTKDTDVIFHIAGLVSAPAYQQLKQVNVEATENIIRIAQKQKIPKVIVLSSLAAMGPSRGRPAVEEDSMKPVSMYGTSKKEMEERIHEIIGKNDPVSVTVLRPPAVYGPREDQIYTFFKMVSNRICPIVGNGEEPRISMVYIHDLIQGILKAANQTQKGIQTYFISGEEPYTWNQIRNTATTVIGKKAVPLYIKPSYLKKIAGIIEDAATFFGAYPVVNREKAREMTMEWTCSIEKAEKELNYKPNYSLSEGISRTIHWYQMNHWL